jgi:PBP1b-binding outer membrane lipoprotein LpoB
MPMERVMKRALTSVPCRVLLRRMKLRLGLLAVLLVGFAGCVSQPKPATNSTPTDPGEPQSKLIVTPDSLLVGQVTTFNMAGRFVVLNFSVGRMPVLNQMLFVYRDGLKVGEVRVTGPERDNNTVADLISGEAAKGDEVRDK